MLTCSFNLDREIEPNAPSGPIESRQISPKGKNIADRRAFSKTPRVDGGKGKTLHLAEDAVYRVDKKHCAGKGARHSTNLETKKRLDASRGSNADQAATGGITSRWRVVDSA